MDRMKMRFNVSFFESSNSNGPDFSIAEPTTPPSRSSLERNVDTPRPQTNASGGSSSVEESMIEYRSRSLNFNVPSPAASTSEPSAPAKKQTKRLAKKSPKTPKRKQKAAKTQKKPAKKTPKTNRIINALRLAKKKEAESKSNQN